MQLNLQEKLLDIGVDFDRVNYLVHIDNKRNVVYIETPKVACTSIKKFMMDDYFGGEFCLPDPSDVHDRSRSPLKQLWQMLPGEAEQVLWGKQYRRFSFVRNPYSRLLSGYLDKLVNNEHERKRLLPFMGFEVGSHPNLLEFLERLTQQSDAERDIHFATQSSLLMIEHVEYNYIGHFEDFREDFLKLQEHLFGVEHPTELYESFGRHHASNANDKISQYFSEREIKLVQEIYQNDFALFGYSRDIYSASMRPAPMDVTSLTHRACSIGLSDGD